MFRKFKKISLDTCENIQRETLEHYDLCQEVTNNVVEKFSDNFIEILYYSQRILEIFENSQDPTEETHVMKNNRYEGVLMPNMLSQWANAKKQGRTDNPYYRRFEKEERMLRNTENNEEVKRVSYNTDSTFGLHMFHVIDPSVVYCAPENIRLQKDNVKCEILESNIFLKTCIYYIREYVNNAVGKIIFTVKSSVLGDRVLPCKNVKQNEYDILRFSEMSSTHAVISDFVSAKTKEILKYTADSNTNQSYSYYFEDFVRSNCRNRNTKNMVFGLAPKQYKQEKSSKYIQPKKIKTVQERLRNESVNGISIFIEESSPKAILHEVFKMISQIIQNPHCM